MSPSSQRPSTLALVLAFSTIYLAWGSTYLGMKVAVETMPPFAMASARFLFAGAILLAVNRLRGLPRATPRQWRDSLVVGVLLLVGGNGLVAWAGQFIPSGVTALLLGMSPFWMVLVDWIRPGGSRPAARTLGGLALGLVGAAWLAAPWEHATPDGLHPGGVIAIVGACLAWAIGSIASRNFHAPAHLLEAAACQMICGGAALGGVALMGGELDTFELAAISRDSWGAWAYLLVVGLIGFPTYAWLIKHSTPVRVSTYAYVNPVVALFLGWLIRDEAIGPRTIAAGALIVAAVVVTTLPLRRKVGVTSPVRNGSVARVPDRVAPFPAQDGLRRFARPGRAPAVARAESRQAA